MLLVIPKERRAYEKRVAATPETVKKYITLGFKVSVEKNAGKLSNYPDSEYEKAGATINDNYIELVKYADIVLKVQRPIIKNEKNLAKENATDIDDELSYLKPGALLISVLSPYSNPESISAYAQVNITSMALELVPRITRAQSMDVLSSQSNLTGYRAVIDASYEFSRAFPMMMTAAGTVAPARVMVLGAGVAGLQAIATAKRLGAIVSATDVRPAAKEQVESLGGKFVMVESEETKNAETAGGYAKEMSDDFKRQQAELVAETIKKQDIVICTALIPGRKAPVLVNKAMVESMKPGSVIIDLAAEQGGNCSETIPGEIADILGVKIVGHHNFPSRVASDASALYAKNILNYLTPFVSNNEDNVAEFNIPWDDEIITATTLTHDGKIIHESFVNTHS